MSSAPRTVQRVAFVLASCGRGGTEQQAQLLVRGLRRRDIHVDVIVLDGDGFTGDFADAPVRVLHSGRGRAARGALTVVSDAVRLGRLLRRGRYDVVHAALARGYVLAALVAPGRRGTRRRAAGAAGPSTRPAVVAWRRNLGIHLRSGSRGLAVERFAARRTDRLVANSEPGRAYWSAALGTAAPPITVVPNALEPWRFQRVEPEADVRRPGNGPGERLVTVGSLKPVKGHDILLRAAAALRRRGRDVEVVVLGEGPDREDLTRSAAGLAVPLVLPGHVADPRPWLATADVYVHPSRSEGASNAVAEAMAQGCAVVASDVGGTAQMLDDTGHLVPPDDVDALTDALETVLADRSAREQLGRAARERARQAFDVGAVVDAHLAAYLAAYLAANLAANRGA